jgi:hypothetical protein
VKENRIGNPKKTNKKSVASGVVPSVIADVACLIPPTADKTAIKSDGKIFYKSKSQIRKMREWTEL